jgi:taurine dioxygenase
VTTTAPPTTDLSVRPLSRNIGAEIAGVELREPLDRTAVLAVRELLLRHKVLFFRDQHLSPAQHLAFAAQFGEPTPGHPIVPGLEDHPEVFEIDYSQAAQYAEALNKSGRFDYDARVWHTDVTFVERPPLGSILNAIVIPDAGGDTLYSNQVAAYEALSPSLREYLGTLTGVHDGTAQFAGLIELVESPEWEGRRITLEPVEHPLVRTNEETGEKALFVNQGFTSHVKELDRAESDALLGFLHQHSVRPQFTVRWHWSEGDLAFWDNRVTQHAVVPDFSGQHRVIQRVTLRGERPV